ncbi:NAD(P)/FAD-dependent oxidoreductase [Flammeovirgaceae bacterium SG7u.111]|nr:NAD(P)/FAD-dependent oxidoreductase [Flammeovirgaceae bacterium SG7u.132]WPO37681.1 NAD(P)/FAD-dependent oxidoreductase [Flammeovirgaceae bacterium SG7u.111]
MKVIVIGAGISGLYAAYLLKLKGFEVTVLEATKRYGGRIRSVQSAEGEPLELGAEFIHGQYSLLKEYVAQKGIGTYRAKGKSFLYYKGVLKNEDKWLEKIPELKFVFDFFENFWKYREHELTVDNFIKKDVVLSKFRVLMDVFAVEYGTSNSRLGLRSLAATEQMWSAGQKDYKIQSQMIRVLDEFVQLLHGNIIYEKPISEINYSESKVQAVSLDEKIYTADAVLVTVPVSVLKKKIIKFIPSLPAEKTAAFHRLGMGAGMKIVLKFRKQFWKKKMFEIWGSKLCPTYYSPFPRQEKTENYLIGYVTGVKAEYLGSLGNKAVDLIVNELDEIFGSNIASTNLEESTLMDWGKEPYIWGMYSYDKPNSEGMREELAKPIDDKVFFAGEATNYNGHPATLHGAMETAERAVFELNEKRENRYFLT